MPTQGTGITVQIFVRSRTSGEGIAGDANNLALYVIRDGVISAATNTPQECLIQGGPAGWYSLALTDTEMDAHCVTVCGSSTTEGAEVVPLTFTTEQPADVWAVTTGLHSYGERLLVVERRLCGGQRQDKSTGATRIYDDDGMTVVRELRYAEDAAYRYQTDEPEQ